MQRSRGPCRSFGSRRDSSFSRSLGCHGSEAPMTKGLQALEDPGSLDAVFYGFPGGRRQSLQSFLFSDRLETPGSCRVRGPVPGSRGLRKIRASFEFVDGFGEAEDSTFPLSSSEPPEAVARTASLAARWITRLGGQSKALSRWTDAVGVDADGQDATSAASLLQRTLHTGLGQGAPKLDEAFLLSCRIRND